MYFTVRTALQEHEIMLCAHVYQKGERYFNQKKEIIAGVEYVPLENAPPSMRSNPRQTQRYSPEDEANRPQLGQPIDRFNRSRGSDPGSRHAQFEEADHLQCPRLSLLRSSQRAARYESAPELSRAFAHLAARALESVRTLARIKPKNHKAYGWARCARRVAFPLLNFAMEPTADHHAYGRHRLRAVRGKAVPAAKR